MDNRADGAALGRLESDRVRTSTPGAVDGPEGLRASPSRYRRGPGVVHRALDTSACTPPIL
jgi:hypothetical protein